MTLVGLLAVAVIMLGVAAALEVGGDAMIFVALKSKSRFWLIPLGCLALAAYGIVVNVYNVIIRRWGEQWTFSKLIGIYVVFFAGAAIYAGVQWFGEGLTNAMKVGLGMIIAGGLVIQFGDALF